MPPDHVDDGRNEGDDDDELDEPDEYPEHEAEHDPRDDGSDDHGADDDRSVNEPKPSGPAARFEHVFPPYSAT
jgi:hypothetical protein